MISLDEITQLAKALVDSERAVESAEEALKACKEAARLLREESMPSAMQELGLESLQLDTGQKITIKQDVYASIPAERKAEAFAWLEDRDFGGLIKMEVVAYFNKGSNDAALKLLKELEAQGFDSTLDKGIHAQTLKAFLREQIAAGAELPLELFGARPVWTTKIFNK